MFHTSIRETTRLALPCPKHLVPAVEYRIEAWDRIDAIDPSRVDCARKAIEVMDVKRLLRFELGLHLPASLLPREKPDFAFSETRNGRQVGIEHTRAAHEGWEEASNSLRSTKDKVRVSRSWLTTDNVSGKQLGRRIAALQKKPAVWSPEEQADAKASEVRCALNRKSAKFFSSRFEKYLHNWLLISDSCPFVLLDLDAFCERLFMENAVSEAPYSRVLFLTVARDRTRDADTDVLLDLSASGVAAVPLRA